jgi:hydrogenase-4 component F
MNPLWLPILVPAIAGGAAFFVADNRLRRTIWAATAILNALFTVLASTGIIVCPLDSWIGLDSISILFLGITSLLFFMITIYGIGYVAHEPIGVVSDIEDGSPVLNAPEAMFTGCLLMFLASMILVVVSRRFGLQWVAIEATTLASTPLIYFHRHRRSLEAAWKYLIICSVAIALALLGIFFLAMSLPEDVPGAFTIDLLVRNASRLNPRWLEMAFIFLLTGYGAKMGLAPMHTWLPDAHSEAPSPVSALLSGALLNCAFLGILRLQQVCVAAGMAAFGQNLLVVFGLLSLGLAGVFMIRQPDFKRLLAYSSIEHMGVLALGIGLGGVGIFGALLHTLNHSVVKAFLFITAGSILSAYYSKRVQDVRGLLHTSPCTGVLWLMGFLAVTGTPPFGVFLSEFTILSAALAQGRWIVAALYLLFLTIAFIGMLGPFLSMSLGASDRARVHESWTAMVPPLVLAMLSLALGLYLPPSLVTLLENAARMLGGTGL